LKLHRTRFADLHTQQIKAKAVLEEIQLQLQLTPHCPLLKQRESQQREHYIKVTAPALDLIRQQCKAEWIGYGDDNTRYFHVQMRQRKTATYIHDIQDDQGRTYMGFQAVTGILQTYYKTLLAPSTMERLPIDPQVIN